MKIDYSWNKHFIMIYKVNLDLLIHRIFKKLIKLFIKSHVQ